ncbi:MAG: hypothetical protein IJI68_07485 [Eggerthellaceae bacterium]|nr:hypothetical protein [Eggerthellaceae bacterium]
MGGFFGAASKRDVVYDVFFGVDYHSHLGTKRAGLIYYDEDGGFQREIHSIENTPFRTRFEADLPDFHGCSGIGCISDSDPQPLLIRSHLGVYALTTVGAINNAEELVEGYFADRTHQFMAMSSGKVNSTELVAALINKLTGLGLEAYLGVGIAILIIKTGVEILQEALGKIIGRRIDSETALAIKETVCSIEGVRGAYDLVLTDYGPERSMGSIHVEVDESLTAKEIDRMTRRIQHAVLSKNHVAIHTVGIYSVNTDTTADDDTAKISNELDKIVSGEPFVLQTHGLYVDEAAKTALFDIIVSYDAPDRGAVLARVANTLKESFPGYKFTMTLDEDISD